MMSFEVSTLIEPGRVVKGVIYLASGYNVYTILNGPIVNLVEAAM